MKSAFISILSVIAISPAAFAGSVGSSSTNSYSTETYKGHREVQGTSQVQEALQVSGYSASAKAEFYVPAGVTFNGAAQFGVSVAGGNPMAYCNATTRVDPSCLGSTSASAYSGQKLTNSETTFRESGEVNGHTFTHTAGSSSSF
jgi:hypothetical protein